MEEFFKLITNYGFPVVISGFLLLRMEKTILGLRDEILHLREKIEELCNKWK